MLILLHSSKTMRELPAQRPTPKQDPALLHHATQLANYLKSLTEPQLQAAMNISAPMAEKVHRLIQKYNPNGSSLPAIDAFLGDIYSGLQASSFNEKDRQYANEHLLILSGLYGVLRALDDIQPYRLEMGYKLPGNVHDTTQPDIKSLYIFWADEIAKQLPASQTIINLSAAEYTKAVFPHMTHMTKFKETLIISPKFLTISPKTGQPVFVTVHAKIARGAFARWLIHHRIEDASQLKEYNDLGYQYDAALSTETEPVFVAPVFKGLGLSVRLTK